MIALTFEERHRQAQLYAAQVRVRRAMGPNYEHAAPWRLRTIRTGRGADPLTCPNHHRKPIACVS